MHQKPKTSQCWNESTTFDAATFKENANKNVGHIYKRCHRDCRFVTLRSKKYVKGQF
jgi:hypothetical protein